MSKSQMSKMIVATGLILAIFILVELCILSNIYFVNQYQEECISSHIEEFMPVMITFEKEQHIKKGQTVGFNLTQVSRIGQNKTRVLCDKWGLVKYK